MNNNGLGALLAFLSTFFIGFSLVIKKLGLKKAGQQGLSAGRGGYNYLLEPIWWAGTLCLGLGELFNFAAYAFAPPTLVTPLGAFSIIICAILSYLILKESLSLLSWTGSILCILGSIVIILNTKPEKEVSSVQEIWALMLQKGFQTYVIFTMVSCFALIFWIAPVYGSSNIFVYVTICSQLGSISVMMSKGVSTGIRLHLQGQSSIYSTEFFLQVIVLVVCIVLSINYLNIALDLFNTNLISPIHYVLFNGFIILASAILFRDFGSTMEIVNQFCGFAVVVIGVLLTWLAKDVHINFDGISNKKVKSPKRS